MPLELGFNFSQHLERFDHSNEIARLDTVAFRDQRRSARLLGQIERAHH